MTTVFVPEVHTLEPNNPDTFFDSSTSLNPPYSKKTRKDVDKLAWEIKDIKYRPSPKASYALDNITLDIRVGEFTSIIGPNGAGKSSLLHLLTGTRQPESGSVHFQGEPLAEWPPVRFARVVGVVAQSEHVAFPISVRDTVAMGRYPHLSAWQRESDNDRRIIEAAMDRCNVSQFATRDIAALSGGERQRVRIARALAQQPSALALDEPTAALDISHEMATFELLRSLTDSGMTVMLITHHINLAARYADRLVVLHHGSVAATGAPHEVLTKDLVERVWQWPMQIETHTGPGRDTGVAQVVPLAQPDTQSSDNTLFLPPETYHG